MDWITRFSLRSPAVIVIAIVLLFVGGIYSARQLPLETMPDMDIPIITIVTVYPGAGPSEVLEEITKPLEKAVRNAGNAKTQTSTSSDNVSVIVMEFDFGADLDKAKREIEDAAGAVRLPEAAQAPDVGRISFDSMPVMRLAVAGKSESSGKILTYVRDEVTPGLQGIEGVADVIMSAEQDEDVRIELLPEKLKAYNLSSQQISQFLTASNIAFPAGELSLKNRVLPVTVGKKFSSLEDLKNMRLLVTPPAAAGAGTGGASGLGGAGATGMGGLGAGAGARGAGAPGGASLIPQIPTVKLGDVANITRGSGETKVASRLNYKPAVGVNIIKDPDANTVNVADDINKKLDSLRSSGPSGLKIRVIEDQSIMVRDSISGLVREGLMGAALAMLVILLFLRNWRSTLIAVVSIPLSVLISLVALRQLGITLNIMSLAGLAVAVGRIVDDSIVVIENIYRQRQKDELVGDDLVNYATKEVIVAVTASTLTVVGAFVPLALVSGFIGQVFTPFAVAVVTSILASLLVAITVVPLMAKYLIAGRGGAGGPEVMGLAITYQNILEKALNRKAIVLVVSLAIFGASLGLAGMIGSNFLPSEEQQSLNVTIDMPAGTAFGALDDKAREVEGLLKDKVIASRLTTVGNAVGSLGMMGAAGSGSQATIFVELKKETDVKEFTKELRTRVAKAEKDGTEISVAEAGGMGGGMSQQIEVLVSGNKIEDLRTAADKISARMEKLDDLANVEDNLGKVKAGVTVDVDNEKAVKVGLTSAQIGMYLRELLVGKDVTRMTIDDESVDVAMTLRSATFANAKELAELQVPSPLGLPVRLGDVAEVRESPTPVTVTRRDESRFASITGDITTADSGKVSRQLKEELKKVDLPEGVSTKISGISETMEEGFGQLGMAMVIAVGAVYLIMVLTFGEARAPLAILFSLPFAATGALIALYVGNQQISVSSMIGGLMLIGIVVTNAIVLIERVQQKRAAGMATREALLEAGTVRFRPIIMTAVSTIFALLPLGLGLSHGGLISQSLAITVIGGMTTSTVLTLIITPIVFEILAGIGAKKPKAPDSAEAAGTPSPEYEPAGF